MIAIEKKGECVACSLCALACPNGVLAVADTVEIVDGPACIDCGICIDECPTDVLALSE